MFRDISRKIYWNDAWVELFEWQWRFVIYKCCVCLELVYKTITMHQQCFAVCLLKLSLNIVLLIYDKISERFSYRSSISLMKYQAVKCLIKGNSQNIKVNCCNVRCYQRKRLIDANNLLFTLYYQLSENTIY